MMRLMFLFWPVIVVAAVFILAIMRSRARRAADSEGGTSLLQLLFAIHPVLLVLSVSFLAAGGGVFYVAVYAPLRDYLTSGTWVETPCTILRSEVEYSEATANDRQPDANRLSIRYTYAVGGRPFEGNRYQFGSEAFSSGPPAKEPIAAAFPPGTQTTCHVDPDHPDHSVVRRNLSTDLVMLIAFCLLFAGGGLWMLAVGVKEARNRMRGIEAGD